MLRVGDSAAALSRRDAEVRFPYAIPNRSNSRGACLRGAPKIDRDARSPEMPVVS